MSNGIEDNPVGADRPQKGATAAKDFPQVGGISRGDGDRQADTSPEQSANNIPTQGAEDPKNGESPHNISNNQSLRNLLQYDSDSSTSSEMELNMRWPAVHESDQSSTSTEDEDDEDDDDDSDEDDISVIDTTPQSKGAIKKQMNMGNNHNLPPKKVEVEEGIDDLDPVPDLSTLNINADEEVFEHMGNVLGVVDRLVTIGALPDTPAYDLNTLLFLDEGKRPLGFVFDVLGQVKSPIYAVRFNAVEDIKNLQITNGTKVYAAPNSKHTQYVFLSQLLKMKGSDASWLGDVEAPGEFVDYSDDENEYYASKAMTLARAAGSQNGADSSFTDSGSTVKRSSIGSDGSGGSDSYKRFENTMNKRNLLNTKFNNYIDSYKQARRRAMQRNSSNGGSGGGGGGRRGAGGAPQIPTTPSSGAAALLPPSFDPTIPPPNMFSPPTFYPATPPVAHLVGPYHHHHHMPFAPHGIAVPSPFRHSPSPSSSSTNTSPYSSPQTGMFTPPHYFVHDYLGRSPVGDNNNSRRLPPPPSAAVSSTSLPPSAAAPLNFIPGNFINPAMLALNQSPSLSLLPPPPPPHQSQQNSPPVLLMQQAPPLEPTNFPAAPPPTGGSTEFPPAGPSHQ